MARHSQVAAQASNLLMIYRGTLEDEVVAFLCCILFEFGGLKTLLNFGSLWFLCSLGFVLAGFRPECLMPNILACFLLVRGHTLFSVSFLAVTFVRKEFAFPLCK
jgi:hypothetical protein